MIEILEHLAAMHESQMDPLEREILYKFLAHAVPFNGYDRPKARRLARQEHCRKKRCFENCQNIVLEHPSYQYYEGYIFVEALNSRWVAKHAWLVDEEDAVIDPTIVLQPLLRESRQKYLGVHVPDEFVVDDFFDPHRWESLLDKYIVEKLC